MRTADWACRLHYSEGYGRPNSALAPAWPDGIMWCGGRASVPERAKAVAAVDHFSDSRLSRDKLYEQVADQIQGLIVAESLRPGDKLPAERELAERLGVSRTVLREALRALTARGLVHVKAGCGTYVRELSVQDATAPMELFLKLRQTPGSYANLSEVRRSLEIEIATLAAERDTDQDVRHVADAVARMEEVGDAETFTRADLLFHLALAQATHNDLFPILLSPIAGLLCNTILLS